MARESRAVSRYLAGYAVPFDWQPTHLYEHCCVVPVFDEPADNILAVVEDLDRAGRCLIILVSNHPSNTGTERLTRHCSAINEATEHWRLIETLDCATLWQVAGSSHLLLLDFNRNPQFSELGAGVGVARKVAMDTALALWQRGSIGSRWLHTTDADARLPVDYFARAEACNTPGVAALVYPFAHIPDRGLATATMLYDFGLRYYEQGLRYAGSSYAYQTTGSLLAISPVHYAQVRGFPRREAGEDFYLLNKLAKTGPIQTLAGAPVRLAGRASDRVPFGTGPGIRRILQASDWGNAPLYYAPGTFVSLRRILDFMPLWRDQPWSDKLNQIEREGLQALGIGKAVSHARRHSDTSESFSRHMITWFDGFRTLKYVHWYRDNAEGKVSLNALTSNTNLPTGLLTEELKVLVNDSIHQGEEKIVDE